MDSGNGFVVDSIEGAGALRGFLRRSTVIKKCHVGQ